MLIDVTTTPPPELSAFLAIQGEEDHQIVAVAHRSFAVDGDQSVGVAVKGEAQVRALLAHRRDEALDVGRPESTLMLRPSG